MPSFDPIRVRATLDLVRRDFRGLARDLHELALFYDVDPMTLARQSSGLADLLARYDIDRPGLDEARWIWGNLRDAADRFEMSADPAEPDDVRRGLLDSATAELDAAVRGLEGLPTIYDPQPTMNRSGY
jgi:hypothetical protein